MSIQIYFQEFKSIFRNSNLFGPKSDKFVKSPKSSFMSQTPDLPSRPDLCPKWLSGPKNDRFALWNAILPQNGRKQPKTTIYR